MSYIRRRFRWWRLAALAAALASCAALALALQQAPARRDDLSSARARWAARPFARYRLVTEHHGGMGICHQDAEILDERVVKVFQNTCPRSAVTVTNLFLDIERFSMTIGGRCGPNGCACDGPIDVDVDYDQRLGYPHQFQVRSKPEERWQYLDYWKSLLAGGKCGEVGFGGPSVTVIAVVPVP